MDLFFALITFVDQGMMVLLEDLLTRAEIGQTKNQSEINLMRLGLILFGHYRKPLIFN